MNQIEIRDERIIRVIDLLEQIQDVNRMIELHSGDDDDFMLRQYKYRRENFLKELGKVLKAFQIRVADLAA